MFLNYTADTFTEAGSNLDPNTSAIAAGSLMLLGSLLSTVILDKFPRKQLYIWTTVGFIVGLAGLGGYSYLKTFNDVSSFKLLPVLSLSWLIFVACAGRLPLTFIIMAEVMPQSIRSFGVSVCNTTNWILCFLMLKFFPTLVKDIGFHNCMFFLAGSAVFGIVFVALFVPETKNRSFEKIEMELAAKKSKHALAPQTESLVPSEITFNSK